MSTSTNASVSFVSLQDTQMAKIMAARIEELERQIAARDAELAQANELFDATWRADCRAVDRWREASGRNSLEIPDRTDLVVWLLEQLEAAESRIAEIVGGHSHAESP